MAMMLKFSRCLSKKYTLATPLLALTLALTLALALSLALNHVKVYALLCTVQITQVFYAKENQRQILMRPLL